MDKGEGGWGGGERCTERSTRFFTTTLLIKRVLGLTYLIFALQFSQLQVQTQATGREPRPNVRYSHFLVKYL